MASKRNETKPAGPGSGRGCGTLFLLPFLLAGCFFFFGMGRSFWGDVEPRFWSRASATVLESSLEERYAGDREDRFVVHATYRYDWAGTNYTGTNLRRVETPFSAAVAQRKLAGLAPGANVECYVDSAEPTSAVLEFKPLTQLIALLFPLLFIVIGGGGIYAMWRPGAGRQKAKSDSFKHQGRQAIPFALFLLLTVITGAVLLGVFLIPWLKARAARDWTPTPCVITHSDVTTLHSSETTTYRLDLTYRYEINGREYVGDRYHFSSGSTSNSSWRQKVSNQLPVGFQTTCLVNPEDPLESVMVADSGGNNWVAIVPAAFFVVGLLGLTGRFRSKRVIKTGLPEPGRQATLAPKSTPLKSFLGLFIFSLVWNGFVWGVIMALGSKKLGTGGSIFLGVFAFIGALMAIGTVFQFLSIFNPRPILTAIPAQIPLGQSVNLRWSFTGNTRRLKEVTIRVTALETSTYRRGTDTLTDTSYFAYFELLKTSDLLQMASGEVQFEVPAGLMHSFEASNNKIVWAVHVHAVIPKWPDVAQEFPITVLPQTGAPK